jgi:hypothetical protein
MTWRACRSRGGVSRADYLATPINEAYDKPRSGVIVPLQRPMTRPLSASRQSGPVGTDTATCGGTGEWSRAASHSAARARLRTISAQPGVRRSAGWHTGRDQPCASAAATRPRQRSSPELARRQHGDWADTPAHTRSRLEELASTGIPARNARLAPRCAGDADKHMDRSPLPLNLRCADPPGRFNAGRRSINPRS